jgi:hypothetical protein
MATHPHSPVALSMRRLRCWHPHARRVLHGQGLRLGAGVARPPQVVRPAVGVLIRASSELRRIFGMELIFIWLTLIALSIVVGVAANTRGRSGGGWFLLSMLISPLIAGLLVLALPSRRPGSSPLTAPEEPFVPDSIHAGDPIACVDRARSTLGCKAV